MISKKVPKKNQPKQVPPVSSAMQPKKLFTRTIFVVHDFSIFLCIKRKLFKSFSYTLDRLRKCVWLKIMSRMSLVAKNLQRKYIWVRREIHWKLLSWKIARHLTSDVYRPQTASTIRWHNHSKFDGKNWLIGTYEERTATISRSPSHPYSLHPSPPPPPPFHLFPFLKKVSYYF